VLAPGLVDCLAGGQASWVMDAMTFVLSMGALVEHEWALKHSKLSVLQGGVQGVM